MTFGFGQTFDESQPESHRLIREHIARATATVLHEQAAQLEDDLARAITLQNWHMLDRLHIVVGDGQAPAVASVWESPWPETFAWERP